MNRKSPLIISRQESSTPSEALAHANAGRPLTIREICMLTGENRGVVTYTIVQAKKKIRSQFEEMGLATEALEAIYK